MNCPGCGAALVPVGNRDHLHCPYCSRRHFLAETDEGLHVIGEPSGYDCSLCRIPLVSATVEGEAVCYCPQCRGFLTGTAAFGRLVTERRRRARSQERTGAPFDRKELRRVITCPACRKRMETHPYGGGGNAVVDTCDRCGLIWLDAGELAVIESYVPYQHTIEPALRLPGAAPTTGTDPIAEDPSGSWLEDLL
jgi:Zn-finger nucleic acid-binding protein